MQPRRGSGAVRGHVVQRSQVRWQNRCVDESKVELFIRRHLRDAREAGIESPVIVARLHGSLAGLHRTGDAVPVDVVCGWAEEEGWTPHDVLVLRGVALAAENATPDLGELTTVRAADGSLVVRLTQDESQLARAALGSVLSGPYAIPAWEFHTLIGFRSDEAQVLRDGLGRALGDRVGERRDGLICVAEFFPPDALAELDRWKADHRDRLGPVEEWRIDVGRSSTGDFARVWIPAGRDR
jgi:hypothetical protein